MPKDEKKLTICTDIENVDLASLTRDNIYKNVVLCTKYAQKIESEQNNRRNLKLKDWSDYNSRFSYLQNSGEERIPEEISRMFEREQKSTNLAIQEWEEGKIEESKKDTSSDKRED